MSRFTRPLIVSPLSDGKTWVTIRPFGYDVGIEGSGDTIEVEVGFMTDFASVPRPLWVVLPKWGRYGNASVIHDWLYWQQSRPRREADRIFLEGMQVLSVGWVTRYTMYWVVRLFGFLAWLRNRLERQAGQNRVTDPTALRASMRSGRRTLTGLLASRILSGLRR